MRLNHPGTQKKVSLPMRREHWDLSREQRLRFGRRTGLWKNSGLLLIGPRRRNPSLHRKVSPRVLLAAVIAVAGFYVMSFANGLEALSRGDILMFLTAISLTGYVYTIDYFAGKAEASAFTCIQFLAVGACAIPLALIFERSTTLADVTACMWPLLYAGVIMCAMGYTLQMIGQETVESTRATILLSLESLFSMLSGMVFYHEHLMPKEYLGCLLIFIAVLIAETKKSTGEGKR